MPPNYDIIAYYHLLGYNNTRKIMKKINTRRIYYLIRHKYLNVNNAVVVLALVVGFGWVMGSIGVMQRNYDLQKEVNYKKRELQFAELETARLQLENRYYKTDEYQELAVRKNLGLVMPGERVLILPANSPAVKAADKAASTTIEVQKEERSNYQQWMDFLFGSGGSGS